MKTALNYFRETCNEIVREGLSKKERVLITPQGARVKTDDGKEVINMCSNNYLGLGNNDEVIASFWMSMLGAFLKMQTK